MRKGTKMTIKSRKKMSKSHIGIVSPNKGKTFSQEWKDKMSKAHIGLNTWIKGRKLTEEHKLKVAHHKEKHWNWKGGVNPVNDSIRKSKEVKLWKKSCLERDNFTCQKTGQVGGKLVVHHINNFADFPELRTSIENGITLSVKAHLEFHKIYGKKNNTRSQLEEFLNKKDE